MSPGNDGVPDRLVCLPGGRVAFVELKTPGKKPTALQRLRHRELRKMGFVVFGCVDSKMDVDRLIEAWTSSSLYPLEAFRDMEAFDE